jgi:hypothetical protein
MSHRVRHEIIEDTTDDFRIENRARDLALDRDSDITSRRLLSVRRGALVENGPISTSSARGSRRWVIASSSATSPSRRATRPKRSASALRRRASSPARAFSARSRIAAIGFADLVRNTGGHAAKRGETLRSSDFGSQRLRMPLRGGEAAPGLVQGVDGAVALALAGAFDGRHGIRIVAAECRFDRSNMPGPHNQHPGQPGGYTDDQYEQKTEAGPKPVIAGCRVNPHHGPSGKSGHGSGKRAAVQHQCLRPQCRLVVDRLLLAGGLLIDRADAILLGRGQVGFWAASLIGGERIGERPDTGLPYAAFDTVLPGKCQANRGSQVAAQTFIARVGNPAVRTGCVEGVTIADQIAGTAGHCLRAPDLRCGRLPVQLQQQDADRDAGGEREHPEQQKSRP